MTYRDISISLEKISVRTHNKTAIQAQLHGFKMKMQIPEYNKDQDELSPEQQEKVDQAMKRALERRAWQRKS